MSGPESGVVIYGEQRGVAAGDFNEDGRIDLAVAQNGAATRLLQNATGRAGLRLRIQGPVGNPEGIGVIVRLKALQRGEQACEVRAGSGYWSQDSPVVTVPTNQLGRSVSLSWPGGKTVQANLPAAGLEFLVNDSGGVRIVR